MKRFISIFVIFLAFLNQNISHGMTAENKVLFEKHGSIFNAVKEVFEKRSTKFGKNEMYEEALKKYAYADLELNKIKSNIETENYLMKMYFIACIIFALPDLYQSAKKLFYKIFLKQYLEDDESSFINNKSVKYWCYSFCIASVCLFYVSKFHKHSLNKVLFNLLTTKFAVLMENGKNLIEVAKLEKII